MSTETKTERKLYPIIELKGRGKLILTNEVLAQIFFLHANIGKTEWSGILVYDVVSGDLSKVEEFTLKAKHIYLMDIGTPGATDYKFDETVVDLFDGIPDALESKLGHVHSHHTMDTTFSGVDMGELQDNVDKHNYYLSLIVNMAGNYTAKVAFMMENKTKSKISYKSDSGEVVTFEEEVEQKSIGLVGMKIIMDYKNDFFYDRFHSIEDEKARKEEEEKKREKERQKSLPKYYTGEFNYGNQHDHDYHRFESSTPKNPKPFYMTDEEVESLTAYIISVDPELNEKRKAYELLNVLAKKASKEDISFYSKYLKDNLSTILKAFFTMALTPAERSYVMSEIVASIKRFSGNKKLRIVVDAITTILIDYGNNGDFRQHSITVSEDELDLEIKSLT